MNELIGRKIQHIRVNKDQSLLSFDTDRGLITYLTEGDCCSETWFADILGVAFLLGGTVIAVEAANLDGYNMNDGRERQVSDQVYGYKLTTDKGYADIIFRNSSNGYYGGNIALSKEPLSKNMTEITEDWSA